jgi:hypothetical protein
LNHKGHKEHKGGEEKKGKRKRLHHREDREHREHRGGEGKNMQVDHEGYKEHKEHKGERGGRAGAPRDASMLFPSSHVLSLASYVANLFVPILFHSAFSVLSVVKPLLLFVSSPPLCPL